MASPVPDSYSCASGGRIDAGRYYIQPFDSVSVLSELGGSPDASDNGKILVVELHASGGQPLANGRQYQANVSGSMAYSTYNTFRFSAVKSITPTIILLRDVDLYGNYPGNAALRECMHLGFKLPEDGKFHFLHKRRLNAMLLWAKDNLSNLNHTKACLQGGSMGGWGTVHYGIRNPDKFAAIYPDRPRWRYNATIGNVAVPTWTTILDSVPVGSAPLVADEDGGGSLATYLDATSYVANTANRIPWIGWCVGRNDGFVQFSDHVDAVAALRSAKRGFAFAWNNGDHSTGSIMSEITQSYSYGTFEIGKGYPLFTSHSGDQDPSVDLVGGINIGLKFRNVTESASAWSCEVTSVLGARTVDVEPISDTFTAAVTPAHVTIPSANTWVPVSFSA